MKGDNLQKFFEKYIKGTPEKAVVADCKIFICRLTNAVREGIKIDYAVNKVYLTSRMLKHLFDRKPAEEFFCVLDNLYKTIRFPDKIYQNKSAKRGEFCLVKKIGGIDYLCSIEIVKSLCDGIEIEEIQVATVFRLRDSNYITKYTLLWSWGNGAPHRSALDTR